MQLVNEGKFFDYVLGFYPDYPSEDEGDGELYYPFDIRKVMDNNQEVYLLSLFKRPSQGLVEDYDGAPRDPGRGCSFPRIFYFS
jgi:hypothetical protein